MEAIYLEIQQQLVQEYDGVEPGNMMRSPALRYSGKVFCFYYQSQMCFKLDTQTAHFMGQYPGSSYLSPFKNKPPMKGWLFVPSEYHEQWKSLAHYALDNLMNKTKH